MARSTSAAVSAFLPCSASAPSMREDDGASDSQVDVRCAELCCGGKELLESGGHTRCGNGML